MLLPGLNYYGVFVTGFAALGLPLLVTPQALSSRYQTSPSPGGTAACKAGPGAGSVLPSSHLHPPRALTSVLTSLLCPGER